MALYQVSLSTSALVQTKRIIEITKKNLLNSYVQMNNEDKKKLKRYVDAALLHASTVLKHRRKVLLSLLNKIQTEQDSLARSFEARPAYRTEDIVRLQHLESLINLYTSINEGFTVKAERGDYPECSSVATDLVLPDTNMFLVPPDWVKPKNCLEQ